LNDNQLKGEKMKRLGQVQVQSLAEAVANKIRNGIIEGKKAPGERLVEQKLASDLGTSQPTVREALKELEHEGFVRKISNKGTYVTELSQHDIVQILRVRMALEQIAVEDAAVKMTEQVAQELKHLVSEMEAAAKDRDRRRFYNADLSFHRAIWNLAGNYYLSNALSRVAFSLLASVLSRQPEFAYDKAVEQHRFILNGLLSGNARQARDVFVKGTIDFWSKHQNTKLPEDFFGQRT
jgi:DNA-binding GntR family transcriptional regulator